MSSRDLPFSHRPTISSEAPALYTSAVSMNVPPASVNAFSIRWASCSSVESPKLIVPRQSSETFRPVRPMKRCSMPPG